MSPVRKLAFPSSADQPLDPPGIEFHIAVQDCDPVRLCLFPAAIDGAGETGVLTHLDHPASGGAGSLRRAVGGGIVDSNDLGGRRRLRAQTGKKPIEQLRAIVHGDDRRDGYAGGHKSKL